MPITYNDSDHVRTRLVAQGKQWRAALNKVRTSKHEGVKDLANTVNLNLNLIYSRAHNETPLGRPKVQ